MKSMAFLLVTDPASNVANCAHACRSKSKLSSFAGCGGVTDRMSSVDRYLASSPPVLQDEDIERIFEEPESEDQTSIDSLSSSEAAVTIKTRNQRDGKPKVLSITRELLSRHFHKTIEEAASEIGLGKSTLKQVCRKLGIEKWPYTNKGVPRSAGKAGVGEREGREKERGGREKQAKREKRDG
eukprot:756174-Hanusia_phi.AAC.1